jgi:outer membrane protein assembly factor BamE (lipoprotein component of BamABCDE complex)
VPSAFPHYNPLRVRRQETFRHLIAIFQINVNVQNNEKLFYRDKGDQGDEIKSNQVKRLRFGLNKKNLPLLLL